MNRMITRIGRLRREQYSDVTATRFGTTAPKKNEATNFGRSRNSLTSKTAEPSDFLPNVSSPARHPLEGRRPPRSAKRRTFPSPQSKSDVSDFDPSQSAEVGQARLRSGEGIANSAV